jgi:hypothetical protein
MIADASRRSVHLIAALFVAAAFLSLPTLSYAHDLITTADNGSHFRPGKNIERPHEQQSSALAADVTTALPGRDRSSCWRVADLAADSRGTALAASASPRGPPGL